MAAVKAAYEANEVYGYVQFPNEADYEIEIVADETSDADIPVSVNYKEYPLPRGRKIKVKEPIKQALEHARIAKYVMVETVAGKPRERRMTEVPAFPFQSTKL